MQRHPRELLCQILYHLQSGSSQPATTAHYRLPSYCVLQ
nr:MAG TPA: hypothetical protein [Caudoviricetes sp.]